MIDTAALREKVLDLAIRGKLVPQDPNDEPASVLLERIRAQKLQMVKEGKLKAKDIKDDTIIFKGDDNCHYEKFADGTIKNIQEEIPFEIPDSWCWCRLGNICPYGDCEKTECDKIHSHDWILDLEDIEKDTGKILAFINKSERNSVSTKHKFYQGQLLYSKLRPYLNKVVIAPKQGYCTSEILPLFFFGDINPHYMQIYLMSGTFLAYTDKISYGVKMPRLGTTDGKQAFIALPPLNEQERIVKTFQLVLPNLESIKNKQKELTNIIYLLKSKIFELAIQGKLVEQDENDEPASVLLERIRAEKKAQLGKKYVESYIYKGDDNCYYENIPENWVKCSLADIALFERGITFSASAKEMIKTENNIACIRTANVQERLELEDLIYVDKTYMKNNSNKLLKIGDIIMSSANSKELVGKSCIVTSLDGEMTFGGFVLVIRGVKVNPYFLQLYLKNLFLKGAFYRKSTQTTNIANISTRDLEMLEVCLPPLNEQAKIVQKVNDIINILEKSLS